MRRRLSSLETFLLKFIIGPILACFVVVFGLSSLFILLFPNLAPGHPPLLSLGLGPLLMVFVLLLVFRYFLPLKKVEMDAHNLYISNFSREAVIPLTNVETVQENRWINLRPITVKFYSQTAFGSRIVFMPKVQWWLTFFRPHPVGVELDEAVSRAKGMGAPPRQFSPGSIG